MRAFLHGLKVEVDVIGALILRETRTRFGKNRLGYLWAFLEPVVMILTFWALFDVVGRQAPYGMDLFTFIGTGVVPYYLFSNSAHRVADSIHGNQALLYYPHVQPLDLVIARLILEAATYTFVFVALMGAHALWQCEFEIDSTLLVIEGFVLTSLLGGAVGLIFMALAQFSPVVDRARGPILRPLFWISGIFFTAETMPEHARNAVLINPLLHPVEMVRGGFFVGYSANHADPAYVLRWILVLGLAGLLLERVVRRRIEVT